MVVEERAKSAKLLNLNLGELYNNLAESLDG
jgi:hypothetical protein